MSQPSSVSLPPAVLNRVLTPLPTDRRPTYHDIRNLQTEAIEMLSAIPTTLGGGQHGHAFLVCRPGTQDYAIRTNNAPPFVEPPNPGPAPVIPHGTNALEERNQRATHHGNKFLYDTCQMAKTIVKLALITAGGVYVAILRHQVTGFVNIQPQRIFAHLFASYGTITDIMLSTNENRMDEVWDPDTQQIEHLWHRQNEVQDISAGSREPIADQTKLRKTKAVIIRTGRFEHAIEQWNARIPAHQTWNHFVDFFTNAFIAYLNSPNFGRPILAAQAGYNGGQPAVGAALAATAAPTSMNYCWSHGITFSDPPHTSVTCRTRAPGHREDATLHDFKGGKACCGRRVGDVQVWRNPNPRPRRNPANNPGPNE